MRAYVGVTGSIFFLLVVVHIARMYMEHWAPARDPFFVGLTVLVAGLCGWSLVLMKRA